jgi:hypothetical protein
MRNLGAKFCGYPECLLESWVFFFNFFFGLISVTNKMEILWCWKNVSAFGDCWINFVGYFFFFFISMVDKI